MTWSANKPAAGNAGIVSQLTIGHHWPGVPEPERSTMESIGMPAPLGSPNPCRDRLAFPGRNAKRRVIHAAAGCQAWPLPDLDHQPHGSRP